MAWLIRFGAALRGLPNLYNHIAVVHHVDVTGTVWCIEGRPGGVGWRDATSYLRSRWTVSNGDQAKTQAQREALAAAMVQVLGTPYDWTGIARDAMYDFGLAKLWKQKSPTGVPGHVVCSSLAAYAYDRVGLRAPLPAADWRWTQPADWNRFVVRRDWEMSP